MFDFEHRLTVPINYGTIQLQCAKFDGERKAIVTKRYINERIAGGVIIADDAAIRSLQSSYKRFLGWGREEFGDDDGWGVQYRYRG